jgi:hypothetical protein
MNDLENILNDFEQLVEQELELEIKLQQKQTLIDSHQHTANHLANSEASRIVELEVDVQTQQLTKFQRTNSMLLELELAFQKGQKSAYKELALLPRINNIQGIHAGGNVSVERDFRMEQLELKSQVEVISNNK